MSKRRFPAKTVLLAAFYLALPLLWLGHVLFGGQVLLPIPLLKQIGPWGTPPPPGTTGLPQWNPLMWDAMAFFYPERSTAAHAFFGNGPVRLWNPYILCGTPLLADVQSAVLYPLNILFLIIMGPEAFGWSAALHMVLAASFTVYWLSQEGLSRTAAVIGAVTFAVGGWSIAWLELPNFLATAVWIPLLLGLLAGAERQRWALTTAGCAFAVGMMLYAGHLQIAFYGLLGVLLYASYHSVAERRIGKFTAFVVGCVLGGMIAAPQLLPARALSAVSHRSTTATSVGYAGFVGGSVPLAHVADLVFPDYFGNPSKGTYLGLMDRGAGEYSEVTAYVGVLPLLLGLHALFAIRRRRSVGALSLILAVGLLLALGTPLNALFYFGVPGFARFGSPSRALVLFAVAMSGLAGFGWDRLRRGGPPSPPTPSPESGEGSNDAISAERLHSRNEDGIPTMNSSDLSPVSGEVVGDERGWKKTLLAGGIVATVALLAGILFVPGAMRGPVLLLTGLPSILRTAFLFALAAFLSQLGRKFPRGLGAAAILLVVADLWAFGVGYNLTGSASALKPDDRFFTALKKTPGFPGNSHRVWSINPSWPLAETPRAVLPPNLPGGDAMHIDGYEGAYLLSYKQQIDAWNGRDSSPPTNGNMVMPTNLLSPIIHELAVGTVFSPVPLPPHIAEKAGLRFIDGEENWNLYAVSHPTSRAEFYETWPPPPGATGQTMDIIELCNRVQIFLSAKRDGFVLLRDTMTPDWRANVDGKRVEPIPTASPIQRVVRVTANGQILTWAYRPASLATGWMLLSLGGLGLITLAGLGIVQGRRPDSAGGVPSP